MDKKYITSKEAREKLSVCNKTLRNWAHLKLDLGSEAVYEYKHAKLLEFINKYKNLPHQGSEEWIQGRLNTIGGSEMGTLLGMNKYSTLKGWIAGKIGLTHFNGNLYTKWGKLFEPITTELIKKFLHIKEIYETGSIPSHMMDGVKYSPDGLAIVKLLCDYGSGISRWEYLSVLFEFKSPFSTIPDGHIPPQYISQPLTGMCSIPNIDIALFVNNLYRKCSLKQFQFNNEYDTQTHSQDEKKGYKPGNPIAMGIIYFCRTKNSKYDDKFADLFDDHEIIDELLSEQSEQSSEQSEQSEHSKDDTPVEYDQESLFLNSKNIDISKIKYLYVANNDPIDYGKSNMYSFMEILRMIEENEVSIHYKSLVIQSELSQISFLRAQGLSVLNQNITKEINTLKNIPLESEFGKVIGLLPWKLFKCDIIPQQKDPQFLYNNKETINNALQILKKINDGNPTPEEKIQRYNTIFNIS